MNATLSCNVVLAGTPFGQLLRILENQGLIRRVKGKGTFIPPGFGGSRWFSTASAIQLVQVRNNDDTADAPGTFYGRIHTGIYRMARTLGLTVKRRMVDGYVRVVLSEYRPPAPEEVGGVILCGTFDEHFIQMYKSEGIPVVVVDHWGEDLVTDCVAVDVEAEAKVVAELLAGQGHTSLGFLARGRRQANNLTWALAPDIQRLAIHLRQAAQHCGLQMRDEWVVFASEDLPLPSAASHLLQLRNRPSAILCFDTRVAELLLAAAKNSNLRCPEDVSVVSRGNPEVGGLQVTCFASDPEMMGEQAVKLLAERMRGQRTRALKIAVPSSLVHGTTVGPAPGRVHAMITNPDGAPASRLSAIPETPV